jgi:hypothetical protein
LKEGVDFVGEREHGPGYTQNEQKQTRNQSAGEMEFEQERTYPSAMIHPLDTPD